MRACDRLKV